jgi:Ser/Thr protein kinase RdoA (MazF antagonist)
MSSESFFNRVNFSGSPLELASQICTDYGIGQLQGFTVPPMGYEDLNIALRTSEGVYFAKVFSSFRDETAAKRYVTTMETVLNAGVNHPFLYRGPEGSNLHQIPAEGDHLRMVLMQYIDSGTVLENDQPLTIPERHHLIHQATVINSLDYRPKFVYDSWAIMNLPSQFDLKKTALSKEDELVIGHIADKFNDIPLSDLPSAFVHGDIRSSNVMKGNAGELHIIDFAVANWQPRVVELAVLLSEIFFDEANPTSDPSWVINEYQRYLKLSEEELKYLPLFVQVGHAMNVLGACYEKAQGNTLGENSEWLRKGRKGLGFDLGAN